MYFCSLSIRKHSVLIVTLQLSDVVEKTGYEALADLLFDEGEEKLMSRKIIAVKNNNKITT